MTLIWTNQRVHVTREDMTYKVWVSGQHSAQTLDMTEMTDLVTRVIVDQASLVPGARPIAETLKFLFPDEPKPLKRGKRS